MKLPGIGPAKAEKLVDIGVKTLEDLKEHKDKLSALQKTQLKYGTGLSMIQWILIDTTNTFRYFADFERKIPREEVKKIEKLLIEAITELNHEYHVTVCGNYRRGLDEINIIAVVTHPEHVSRKRKKNKDICMKMIVECLKDRDLIADTISLGSTTFMVIQ